MGKVYWKIWDESKQPITKGQGSIEDCMKHVKEIKKKKLD